MKPYQIANKVRSAIGNYPECECYYRLEETKTVDSRKTIKNGMMVIRRRRICKSCNKRLTTYELDENDLGFE